MLVIEQILWLSLATAAISLTITRARIFEEVRVGIDSVSEWLGDLIHCPYCTSHWIAFAFCVWYKPRVLQSDWVIMDVTLSAFAIIAISARRLRQGKNRLLAILDRRSVYA
jgi:hypothetical protein